MVKSSQQSIWIFQTKLALSILQHSDSHFQIKRPHYEQKYLFQILPITVGVEVKDESIGYSYEDDFQNMKPNNCFSFLIKFETFLCCGFL